MKSRTKFQKTFDQSFPIKPPHRMYREVLIRGGQYSLTDKVVYIVKEAAFQFKILSVAGKVAASGLSAGALVGTTILALNPSVLHDNQGRTLEKPPARAMELPIDKKEQHPTNPKEPDTPADPSKSIESAKSPNTAKSITTQPTPNNAKPKSQGAPPQQSALIFIIELKDGQKIQAIAIDKKVDIWSVTTSQGTHLKLKPDAIKTVKYK